VGEHMHAFREEAEEEIPFPGSHAARTCKVLLRETDPAKEAKSGDLGEAEEADGLARAGGERDL